MKNIRTLRNGISPTVIALGLLALIMLHAWRPGAVIMQGDSVYFPAPFTQLSTSFLSWNHVSALAGSYSQTVCYTLLLIISGCIQKIVGYSLSQIVVLWLLIGGAWIGAFRLARRFGATYFASFASAWFYAVNPWAQQFYAYNYQLQVLIVCVPFIVMWMMDAASGARYSARTFILRFALFAALPASVFGINPALLALTIFVLVPFIPFVMMDARRVRPVLKACLYALPLAIIAAGWWLIPTAWADLHSSVTAQLSPNAWSWVTAHSSFLDNFRFEPTWWWKPSYVPYCDSVDNNVFFYGSQFTAIFLLIVGLMFERSEKRRNVLIYSGISVIFALFVSKGYHEPFSSLNEAFFKLPGAFFFREPTTKAPLLALAMLIVPVAYAIDVIGRATFLQTRMKLRRFAQAAIFAATLAAGYPTISGIVFHDVTDEVPGLYAHLPDYWRSMADSLNRDTHGGGVLMLPFEDFYQVNYGWFYGADSIADWLLTRPVVHLGDAGYAYTESPVQQSLERQLARAIVARDPHLADLCRALGIRYILYRGDVTVAPELRVSLDDIRSLIGNRPIQRFGQLSVVALNNDTDGAAMHAGVRYNDAHDAGFLSMLTATDGTARVWPAANPHGAVPSFVERTKPVDLSTAVSTAVSGIVATDAPIRGKMRGSHVVWHVSRNNESPKTIAQTYNSFSPQALHGGYPIPAILEQSYSESGRHRTYRIFNPSSTAVPMNLRLTVHSKGRTRYIATIADSSRSAIVEPVANVDWISFNNITVPAGQSSVTVNWQSSSEKPSQQAMADLGGTFLGVLQFVPLSSGQPPEVVISRQMSLLTEHDHKLSGTIAIDRSLQDAPDMYLGIGMGSFISFTGVVFDVEREGRHYLIYSHLYASNIVVETRKIIELAFERARLPLRRSEFSKIIVHAVGLDGAFLNGPNEGDPGIAALTIYEKLLDRNAQPVPLQSTTFEAAAFDSASSTTLSGEPLYSLTGLNMIDNSTAIAEVYSLLPAPAQVNIQLHVPDGERITRRLSLSPGYSYVRVPVSPAVANAVRDQTIAARFQSRPSNHITLTAHTGSVAKVGGGDAVAVINYTVINKTLRDVPALWILADVKKSMPGAYWGAIWDLTWHHKRYLVYQHEFIQGMTLSSIPHITRTLAQNTGVGNIRAEDVYINGVAATAETSNGTTGIARIAEFDPSAPIVGGATLSDTWNFVLPAAVTGDGNLEIKLCGKDDGPVGFTLLDARGNAVQRGHIAAGVFSQESEVRPRVGITYSVATPFRAMRVTVPFSAGASDENGSPCKPELRIAANTRYTSPVVTVGKDRYPLHGASGELNIRNAVASETMYSVDPGSAKTAFASVAPAASQTGAAGKHIALASLPIGAYAVGLEHPAGPAIVSFPEGFDPLWIAIGSGNGTRPHILAHFKIDGWANGFAVNGETNVFLINALNVIQMLAVILSTIVICTASLKLRSFKRRSTAK